MKYKICSKCKKRKSIAYFFKAKTTKDGLYSSCKKCKLSSRRKWANKNKKYLSKYYLTYYIENRLKISKRKSKKYYKEHLDRRKLRKKRQQIKKQLGKSIRKKYGMEIEEYYKRFNNQKELCKICSKKEKSRDKRLLSVDHDHKTGENRGLLCHNCNVGLGLFNDNIKTLQKAIKYLKSHLNKKGS